MRPPLASSASALLLLLLAVLTIRPTQQSHSGDISDGVARSPTDTDERDSAPRLVHQPASVEVKAQQPHTIECAVEAQPEPEVKWFKDGRLLPSRSANLDQMGAELTFRQVEEEDAGEYQCQASNYLGAVTSERFQVTVQSSIPDAQIRLEPQLAQVHPDEQFQFSCSIPLAEANRRPQVFWRRNGRRLANIRWMERTQANARQASPEMGGQADELDGAEYIARQLSANQFTLQLARAKLADDQANFTCLYQRQEAAGEAELARESPPARLAVTQGKQIQLPDTHLAPAMDNLADWPARPLEIANQTTQLAPPRGSGALELLQQYLAIGRPAVAVVAVLLALAVFALLQLSFARRRSRLNSYMKHQYAGSAGSNSLAGNPFDGDPVLSSLMSRTLAGTTGALGGTKKYRSYRDHLRKVAASSAGAAAPDQPLSASDLVDGYLAAVAAASQQQHSQRGAQLGQTDPFLFGSAHLPSLYGQGLAAREQARTLLQASEHMRSLSNLNHLKQLNLQQQQQLHQSQTSRANQNGSHLNLPMSFSFGANVAHSTARASELQAGRLLDGASQLMANAMWPPHLANSRPNNQLSSANQQTDEHYQLVNCSSVSPSSSSSLVCSNSNSNSSSNRQHQQQAHQTARDSSSLNHYSTIEANEDEDDRYEQLDGPSAAVLRSASQLRCSLVSNSSTSGCGDSANTTGSSSSADPLNRFAAKRNNRQQQQQQQRVSQPNGDQKRHNFHDQLSPYAVSSICSANLGPNQQPQPPVNSEAMRALNEQFDINKLLLEEANANQQPPLPFAAPPPPPPAQPPVAACLSADSNQADGRPQFRNDRDQRE